MKTMERSVQRELSAHPSTSVRRPWWIVAVVAVVALLAGLLIGRWTAPSEKEPRAVVPGGAGLTDRQQQMIDVLDRSVEAWHAGDGAAVVALFTPSGTFDTGNGVFRVGDGSLATYVENGQWSSLTLERPMLVSGNAIVFSYTLQSVRYLGEVEFTTSGDVLISLQRVIIP